MADPIIRKELFPFVCQNPDCGQEYDVEGFRDVLNLWGLVYADCGETIYQGITCPKCRKTSLKDFPRNNPMVDLREFIIAPNPDPFANTREQVLAHLIETKYGSNNDDILRFRSIPDWNDETVSFSDMLKHYTPEDCSSLAAQGVPYLITLQEVERRLNEENKAGTVQLRRLYPDIPRFKCLLTVLSEDKLTEIEFFDDGGSVGRRENTTAKEIQERRVAWIGVLEEAAGKPLKGSAKRHLESRGFSGFDEDKLNSMINKHLEQLQYKNFGKILRFAETVGFEETIWKYFERLFDHIFCSACSEIAFIGKRKELLDWGKKEKLKDGTALFVDAPMGLGKTHSIKQVLLSDPTLSAIIFMPTIKLCEQMVEDLKRGLAPKKGYSYWDIIKNEDEIKDENSNYLCDEFGVPETKLKKKFLKEEVYFADGINEEECPHFDEFIKRFRENWIKKKDICGKCEEKSECRFVSHWKRAPRSRIVVTTHAQYDHFYLQSGIRKWLKYGYDREEEAVPRDVFIVDEDLVLSRCYQPIGIDRQNIGHFIATLLEFLPAVEDYPKDIVLRALQTMALLRTIQTDNDAQTLQAIQSLREIRSLNRLRDTQLPKIRNNIHTLFSQTNIPEKTSVIPPVDPNFRFPAIVKKKWSETFPGQTGIIPEYLDRPEIVGNYLEALESGLRLGVVVQKFTGRDRVYLPNPKFYDLSGLPPHVFFDGTMLDRKFLEKKLQNVRFERVKIKVKPLWRLRVWQNVNTDLPKKGIRKDKPDRQRVEQFVRDLIGELGKDHKYLFLTTKATSEAYLEVYLDELRKEEPDFNYVLQYFGKLKGLNEAKDCDIGVMLGSYNPSDAVEITMALEFMQGKLPDRITATENNLWKWRQTNTVRRYEPDYADVQHLADKLRQNEHRQGIARTRYLYHDVDFYVVSKDRVADYEPFLSNIETDQYRADIFLPRPERPDTKNGKVKEAVLSWFDNHKTLTEMELHRESEMSRTTLRKHLRRMSTEGLLDREKKKYILHSNSQHGHKMDSVV